MRALARTPSLGAVALAACAGSAVRPPTAALSRSLDAENALRPMLAAWARASRAERIGMEPRLATFRERYASDDASRVAEVLLAWIALDKGSLPEAEARAHRVRIAAGPGTAADVARTVEGASLRRQGHPRRALELLLPLVNKLIDPWARALFNHEVVDSAVAAGRWPEALELMRAWLREAGPEERAAARAAVEQDLTAAPAADLLDLLEHEPPGGVDDDAELRKLVAQRLAFVARASRDAELAHRLLGRAGSLLGEQGEVVAQLAAGASRARVEPRTVGLLLSMRDDAARRRDAEILQGVAFGLGLPGSAAHLVSRDDHGSLDRVEEALLGLSADGASVLIAGSDVEEANRAAAFAESHRIPVLLLRAPSSDRANGFAFVVGADPDDLESVLVAALASRGNTPVALVAEDAARARPARPEVVEVRGCTTASSPWKNAAVAGVVLSGSADCARASLGAATTHRVRFAAGFDAEALPLPPGTLVATAGGFPFASSSGPLTTWATGHPVPPAWWTALGRDAAVIAWAGVKGLPARSTEEPGEVDARRAQVAAALAAAQGELWTTDAPGFRGTRRLPRTIGVREVGAAVKP